MDPAPQLCTSARRRASPRAERYVQTGRSSSFRSITISHYLSQSTPACVGKTLGRRSEAKAVVVDGRIVLENPGSRTCFRYGNPPLERCPALYLILTEITYGGKTIAVRRRPSPATSLVFDAT